VENNVNILIITFYSNFIYLLIHLFYYVIFNIYIKHMIQASEC